MSSDKPISLTGSDIMVTQMQQATSGEQLHLHTSALELEQGSDLLRAA